MSGWNGQCPQSANFSAGQSTSDLVGAFPSNTAAGNLLLAEIVWYGVLAPAITISDTQGNVYALAGSSPHADGSSGCAIYYCANTIGGANSVTFHSPSNLYKSMTISEYPGLSTTALDASASTTGNSGTLASGNLTPAGAGELVVGVGYKITGSDFTGPANGWTARPSFFNNATGISIYSEDRLTFDGSAVSSAFTANTAAAWASAAAAFKNMGPAAGGGGGGACPIGSNVIIPCRGAT